MADKSPPYLVTVAVELRNAEDRKLFCSKLLEIAAEDASFGFQIDGPTRQFLFKGRDDYHLSTVIGRAVGNAPIEINVGAPQVAYRETITTAEKVDYTDKKKRGGDVRVKLILEPTAPVIDSQFNIDFVDGSISKEFSRAIKQGIEWAFAKGPLGFPVIGLRVKVMTIDYGSNGPGAVQAVVHRVLKETLLHTTCLLEPFVKVEIVTPEKCRDDVITDLNNRRGRIDRKNENKLMVVATVPLANLFGYTNVLKSLTGDEAKCTTSFSHYEPIPSPDDPAKKPAMIMRVSTMESE